MVPSAIMTGAAAGAASATGSADSAIAAPASLSSTSVLRPVCFSSTMPFSASFSAKSRKLLTP